MATKPFSNITVPDFTSATPPVILDEMDKRLTELSNLEKQQIEMGTTAPAVYSSIGKYIANPSTVSVETFKRMLDTDETIGAGTDFANLAMIARFGAYKHKSDEITEFVNRALNSMEDSWHESLDEMFSAEWAGFSVTEKVWQAVSDFDGMAAFVPKRLATLPPLTIVFAVDANGAILPDGVFQYQRYGNTSSSLNGGYSGNDLDGFRPDLYASRGDAPYPIRVAQDVSYMTVPIPRQKVIHLKSSSTGKFRNPYGRSIFRRIYKNWVLKDAFLKMWVVAADRRGTPLIVGYAAPNDTVKVGGPVANGFVDAMGQPLGYGEMPADAALARTLDNLTKSNYVVVPGRKDENYYIEAIQVSGDMNVFKDGIDYFNRSILKGQLIPPLVMTGGDGAGSYALGESHKRIFNQVIDGKLKSYKQGLVKQLIEPLIAYNFPRKLWERDGAGEFALEEFDPEVMEKLANIYGGITNAGYMSPSDQVDLDYVRQKLGNLPVKKAVDKIDDAPESFEFNSGNEETPATHENLGKIDDALSGIEDSLDVTDSANGEKRLSGFDESKHPRDGDGKFGEGDKSSPNKKTPRKPRTPRIKKQPHDESIKDTPEYDIRKSDRTIENLKAQIDELKKQYERKYGKPANVD